MKTLGAAANL